MKLCTPFTLNPDFAGFMQGQRRDKVRLVAVATINVGWHTAVIHNPYRRPAMARTKMHNQEVEQTSRVGVCQRHSAESREGAFRVGTESETGTLVGCL